MASSVDVSVEVLHECLIQEVTLDGQEIYLQPLSMSENLTKLAHKIDFSKDESDEKGKPTSEGGQQKEEEEEKPSPAALQASLWPWDSVRSKLRAASMELGVLIDVLAITRQKNFLVADLASTSLLPPHLQQQYHQCPQFQQHMEAKNSIQTFSKKKALSAAATILIRGFERLSSSLEPSNLTNNFHNELLKLRQHWRLKKVGNVILGDLSYKSAGSRYRQAGSFEVLKATDDEEEDRRGGVGGTESAGGSQLGTMSNMRSSLRVTIPSELEGVAYIHVSITDTAAMSSSNGVQSDSDHLSTDLFLAAGGGDGRKLTADTMVMPSDAHWLSRLEAAQNVIFCKEVFAQLASEAVQSRSSIPHVVVGNQIIPYLFPGVYLCISLCHNTKKTMMADAERGAGMGLSGSVGRQPSSLNTDTRLNHNHVVEHSLHQLLRMMHYRASFHPMPHPITATFGVSKRRRLAGPCGHSRSQLMELNQNDSMLKQIIQQARQIVIRQRALRVIDHLAVELCEPQITAHWSNVNSATESLVKITISFSGYESCKTSFALHIGTDYLEAYCRDGRIVRLSYSEQELRDFIMGQVAEHHIHATQMSAKTMGWNVLSVNNYVGVGDVEPVGNAIGIMLASPFHDRILSVRSSPSRGVKVQVQTRPNFAESHVSTAVPKSKWSGMNEIYQEIDIEKVDGTNFANKIELIMACLMPERLDCGLY